MELCNHQYQVECSAGVGINPSTIRVICEKCENCLAYSYPFEPGTSLKEKFEVLSEVALKVKRIVEIAE